MQVKQIYELMNNVTNEITGKSDLLLEDLSNIVDVGNEILSTTGVDSYVKKLVNRIGKVIFVNRVYSNSIPSVLMDKWEFGSIMQKITSDLPQATENETWSLVNGQEYKTDVFYQPNISAKFYNSKVTFEIPMSFTEIQVKQSFTNAEQLNGFLSMLVNSVDKAITVKMDSLVMRTINNMIGETLADGLTVDDTITYTNTSIRAVNLLAEYKKLNSGSKLNLDTCLKDADFIKFASYTINLYKDRMSKLSTLFNVGKKERFTPSEYLHVILLSDFVSSQKVYLESDTHHKDLVALPKYDSIPYWQGSGDEYSLTDVSTINVKTSSGKTVNTSGILGVMFDRDALGVCNVDNRVTTNYNPKAEFYTNFYKFDASYFNDLNENFVVFFVA